MEYIVNGEKYDVRPDVLTYDDIVAMVPPLKGHHRFVKLLMKVLSLERVNRVHGAVSDTPGPEFVRRLIKEQFNLSLVIYNEQILDNLPQGAFITVSNHPLGALDGIALIHMIASRRPKFKVMVNMILNHLSGMQPNFIAVDQSASSDPQKRAVSIAGIRKALNQLAQGEPIGFFPAGAMSNVDWRYRTHDRQWQDTVLQIIKKAKVPVIPIYFHDKNSFFCNLLGRIYWPLRTLRIPKEVFRLNNKSMHISVGDIIYPDEFANFSSTKELGDFLRQKTYALRGGE